MQSLALKTITGNNNHTRMQSLALKTITGNKNHTRMQSLALKTITGNKNHTRMQSLALKTITGNKNHTRMQSLALKTITGNKNHTRMQSLPLKTITGNGNYTGMQSLPLKTITGNGNYTGISQTLKLQSLQSNRKTSWHPYKYALARQTSRGAVIYPGKEGEHSKLMSLYCRVRVNRQPCGQRHLAAADKNAEKRETMATPPPPRSHLCGILMHCQEFLAKAGGKQ